MWIFPPNFRFRAWKLPETNSQFAPENRPGPTPQKERLVVFQPSRLSGVNLLLVSVRVMKCFCHSWESRWWFQFFLFSYFHPYWGKIPILTNIFQMGWNHQLVMDIDSARLTIFEQKSQLESSLGWDTWVGDGCDAWVGAGCCEALNHLNMVGRFQKNDSWSRKGKKNTLPTFHELFGCFSWIIWHWFECVCVRMLPKFVGICKGYNLCNSQQKEQTFLGESTSRLPWSNARHSSEQWCLRFIAGIVSSLGAVCGNLADIGTSCRCIMMYHHIPYDPCMVYLSTFGWFLW